jgi:hypothetical protein
MPCCLLLPGTALRAHLTWHWHLFAGCVNAVHLAAVFNAALNVQHRGLGWQLVVSPLKQRICQQNNTNGFIQVQGVV